MTTRVVHRNRETFDVLIDRTTPWGNPFSSKPSNLPVIRVATRKESIECFKFWVLWSPNVEAVWIREHVHELQGQTLGCWCHPLDCHGWVLADMADGVLLWTQESLFL